MSSANERCTPTTSGFAREVYSLVEKANRPPLERFPVPQEPGVYEAARPGEEDRSFLVQLGDDGQWWPYPFSFSGWRESELSLSRLTPRPELQRDIPEIPNPEKRAAVKELETLLSPLAEGSIEISKLARQIVLEEGWAPSGW